jgi:hypothetical protein
VEKRGLPYTRGTDNGGLVALRKGKIDTFENLHPFGFVSIRLEKPLYLDQLFQTIASLAF